MYKQIREVVHQFYIKILKDVLPANFDVVLYVFSISK